MIEWAQQNLSGHWGLKGTGAPLHRLQNDSDQKANRRAICDKSKFTKDPAITDDTCDEFPFAGTSRAVPSTASLTVRTAPR